MVSSPKLGNTAFLPLARDVGVILSSLGAEAYLVGGAVRDAFLGLDATDVDLAVVGNARHAGAELANRLGGTLIDLDMDRGIVRVALAGHSRSSFIDINSAPGGILDDLARRDFTVNAMAVSLRSGLDQPFAGDVIDPYGGRGDLEQRVLKALSPDVFANDPSRLLRGPRLAAFLRFDLDPGTAKMIARDAHLVASVAPERVREELLKILAEPGVASSLGLLDSLGLLTLILPELEESRGVSQPKEHHWDVFNHSVQAAVQAERIVQVRPDNGPVLSAVPWSDEVAAHFAGEAGDGHSRLTLLKLTCLLHDVAKPRKRTVEVSGRVRFIGHDTLGAEMARDALSRLRLSGRAVELAGTMIEHHLRPSQMSHGGNPPTRRAIFRYHRDLGDAAIDTLYLNLADYLAARGPDLDVDDWQAHCSRIRAVLEGATQSYGEVKRHRLIDGDVIMRELGMEAGPEVGHLIDIAEEAQAAGEVSTREEALELVRTAMVGGGAGA